MAELLQPGPGCSAGQSGPPVAPLPEASSSGSGSYGVRFGRVTMAAMGQTEAPRAATRTPPSFPLSQVEAAVAELMGGLALGPRHWALTLGS